MELICQSKKREFSEIISNYESHWWRSFWSCEKNQIDSNWIVKISKNNIKKKHEIRRSKIYKIGGINNEKNRSSKCC